MAVLSILGKRANLVSLARLKVKVFRVALIKEALTWLSAVMGSCSGRIVLFSKASG